MGPPELLAGHHRLADFHCGKSSLDKWLVDRALKCQEDASARTYVVCADNAVLGYYALAAGSVTRSGVPGAIRRNMPDPIPVVVLARLAVHAQHAGQGVGAGLLKDAVLRALRLRQDLGIRAMLCHAIDEEAASFYRTHGFVNSTLDPLTLLLNLNHLP